MTGLEQVSYSAFEGSRLIASGELELVALKTKQAMDRGAKAPVLIFADLTGEQVELDLRGTAADVRKRLSERGRHDLAETGAAESASLPRGPGRPRLGVVAREVTLLPRHWSWLNEQPGGASVALRKLVDEARRANVEKDRIRRSQERTYRFMSAIAGNLRGFEEAARALFAWDLDRFHELTRRWPKDIRLQLGKLLQEVQTDET
jgi:hypothetical protein